jgi:hypothetical protein
MVGTSNNHASDAFWRKAELSAAFWLAQAVGISVVLLLSGVWEG